MKKTAIIMGLLMGTFFVSAAKAITDKQNRPNIIFLMDEQGQKKGAADEF